MVAAAASLQLLNLLQAGGERTLVAVREVWRKNCGGLDPQQQDELWQVLHGFSDCFALSDKEVGWTHLVQHVWHRGCATN